MRDVFIEGQIYFIDGDCYSRMTRARLIAEHPGTIIQHHDFENWPEGVRSHTTAPLDYLIVGLKGVLDVAFRVLDPKGTSLLRDQTLDLAGALISPLLGMAGAIFLAWWIEKYRVRFGSAALLFYAVSPILVHGTLLGRPDHQSLLMTLFTVALGAELALAGLRGTQDAGPSARRWGMVSGLAWGLSLWVSLYEPVILLATVLALWIALDRRALWSRARLPGAVAFAVVLVIALALEGWSIALPDAEMRGYFANWERTIGELAHLHPTLLFGWLGWSVLAAPLLLWAPEEDRRALPLFVLLVVVLALTIWQARWGYFLGITFAWVLPWLLQAWRKGIDLGVEKFAKSLPRLAVAVLQWCLVWPLFFACFWPILKDWDARLFPHDFAREQQTMQRAEVTALRSLAVEAIGANGGPFLASWWLSPAIAYWSRQPGVAGTSHESLPGIVDTARVFLSVDPGPAGAILRKRSVRWVLADEPRREIDTSSVLLGVPAPDVEALATTLYEEPADAPDFLREWKGPGSVRRDGLRFYRLYQVIDANLPP